MKGSEYFMYLMLKKFTPQNLKSHSIRHGTALFTLLKSFANNSPDHTNSFSRHFLFICTCIVSNVNRQHVAVLCSISAALHYPDMNLINVVELLS